jgi:hypothetical protein
MREESQMAQASALRDLIKNLGLDPSKVTLEEISEKIKNMPNREKILEQIRSQEKGIPYEYQFGYMCWWLGKCTHLQFIDPKPEFPYLSRISGIKYPDIFAIFPQYKNPFSCFIQVKSSNNMTLAMSKNYVNGLKRHPLVRGYPILIAWKNREFWTLFDIDTFRTSAGSVRAKFLDAMEANLMSALIGDITFQGFKKGIEWHYIIEPKDTRAINDIQAGNVKEFTGKLVDISVIDPSTDNSMEISGPLFYLLSYLGWWESFDTKYAKLQIIAGETTQHQPSLFAYQALIFGTMNQSNFESRRTIDWKALLKNQIFVFTYKELHNLIKEGQNKGMGFEYSPLRYLPSIKNPCMEDFE